MIVWLMSVTALVAPVQAEEARSRDSVPIACPYRSLPRTVDRDALASLARSGFDAKTDAEKHAFRIVGERIAACQASNGWGERSRQAAFRYLSGRVLLSNARYKLRDYKVTTAQIEAAHAAISAQAREAVARGSIASDDMTVAWKTIVAGGAQLDSVPQEQRGEIAQWLLQGLAGVTIMEQAEVAFNAR